MTRCFVTVVYDKTDCIIDKMYYNTECLKMRGIYVNSNYAINFKCQHFEEILNAETCMNIYSVNSCTAKRIEELTPDKLMQEHMKLHRIDRTQDYVVQLSLNWETLHMLQEEKFHQQIHLAIFMLPKN